VAATHFLSVAFLAGVAVNYPWELAQSPLFTAPSPSGNMWLHCFFAALGDGLIVVMLFALCLVVLKAQDWSRNPPRRAYALLMGAGTLLAVAVEWGAVHVLQRWSYVEAMPLIPGLQVGLVPVIQMALLPALVLRLTVFVTARWAEP
jgi:hypothetical protein